MLVVVTDIQNSVCTTQLIDRELIYYIFSDTIQIHSNIRHDSELHSVNKED